MRCITCSTDLGRGKCIRCAAFADGVKAERRNWRTLTDELEELERTDPRVRAAAEKLDRTVKDILAGKYEPAKAEPTNG